MMDISRRAFLRSANADGLFYAAAAAGAFALAQQTAVRTPRTKAMAADFWLAVMQSKMTVSGLTQSSLSRAFIRACHERFAVFPVAFPCAFPQRVLYQQGNRTA